MSMGFDNFALIFLQQNYLYFLFIFYEIHYIYIYIMIEEFSFFNLVFYVIANIFTAQDGVVARLRYGHATRFKALKASSNA